MELLSPQCEGNSVSLGEIYPHSPCAIHEVVKLEVWKDCLVRERPLNRKDLKTVKSVSLLLMKMGRDPVEVVVTSDILALDMIMTYLNVRDLLSCRLVSDLWNRAASLELRVRSIMIKTISTEDQLMELEECIERSWDFPFAALKLDSPWEFQSDAAMEFFQNYGARFTRLRLGACLVERMHDVVPFINHLPNLSILELGHCADGWSVKFSHSSAARQPDGDLKLSKVRTIRIYRTVPGHCEQVLGQVLKAVASPSLQIELLDATPGMLRVVKSAGKLGAVCVMKFHADNLSWTFRSEIDQLLSTGSPSLTKLDFRREGCLSKYGLKKVLFSSQRTLKELHLGDICMSELSIYNRLAFPKLTTLSFHVNDCEYLFRGRHQCNFPALKRLKLKISCANYNPGGVFVDDLVFPTVISIDLDGYVNEDGMKKLVQIFPNVTEMRLDSGYYSGQFRKCGRNPSEMWNVRAFKCLEKLVIGNFLVGQPAEPYINMDSFLTGITSKECQELNLNKIPFKETSRVTPSILELESLKQLVVFVKLGERLIQPTEDAPFISMVSVWYALDMMPNLRANFVYEPLLHTKRDTGVLEAAFKPVQEYVKLDRFFY